MRRGLNKEKGPENAIKVTTYQRLEEFVRAFGEGNLNLLVILGRPGVQKSSAVKQIVKDATWIKGHATPFGIYRKLWESKDRSLVIDDVDDLLASGGGVMLLKCLCSTERVKRVMWHSNAASLKANGIPREFETKSRVCIIGNEWKSLNRNAEAVEDRGIVVLFEPKPLEVHLRVAEWFWDQEIFDFIAGHLRFLPQVSMRLYFHAWELKKSGLDWREVLLELIFKNKRKCLAAKLLSDSSYSGNDARARAFEALGGGGRATFYNYAARLKDSRAAVPKIELKNTEPPSEFVGACDLELFSFLKSRLGYMENS